MIMILQTPDGDFVRVSIDELWGLSQMGWANNEQDS